MRHNPLNSETRFPLVISSDYMNTWKMNMQSKNIPFRYLSWMREARSCWLIWELLHPFNKERTSIIRKSLNIHEIPTQDILFSFLEPLSWLMFLKSTLKWTRKCWNSHTLPNFTNGTCTITEYFCLWHRTWTCWSLLNMVFGVLTNNSELMWTACFKLWLDF